jgi:uncharacterized protein YutE (UPF0331/DUF86 family)
MSPSKIQLKTVAAKAELIRAMLAGIETLPLGSEAELAADLRMVAAGESFLRRALEALLDLGRHVLAKGFGKAVPEYAAVAAELGAEGVLPPESAMKLRQMAGYRNRLVHAYDAVTPGELYSILTRDRGDIAAILEMIRDWIAAHPEICNEEL